MQNWLRSVVKSFQAGLGNKKSSRKVKKSRRSYCPLVEMLEDRLTPSTVSSIAFNFNGTAIPAGDSVWFNSSFQASGLPKNAQATIHVEDAAINFTTAGVPYHVAVPNGVIVLTPGATSASVSYDPVDNDFDVSAPSSGAGDIFMNGATLTAPNGLPGGIKNVTWQAGFWSDTPGITVNWKWAAAVYKPGFSGDYNALGIKPVDNKDLSIYKNGDQSGAPESFKSLLVGGGTGGGGSNYIGNMSPSTGVKPALGDGLQDYPYASSNPLTNVAFNESSVVRGANLDSVNGFFQLWYSDEHAMSLGVGTTIVKTASGTTTTNYPIAAMTNNPSVANNPSVGTTATTGDQAGTDASGRPMAPSLYVTDITSDANSRSGDWQSGGTAYSPNDVFGTWKSFTRTVDYTTSTPTVTLSTVTDPAKNSWSLGNGSDAPPAGLSNEGYGTEVRWSLAALQSHGVTLIAGHTYRFYVIVHDGDQNKVGGDAGQASFNYYYPGSPNSPATISGSVFDLKTGMGLANVLITLSGTDINGNVVNLTAYTDTNGYYQFSNVTSGSYSLIGSNAPNHVLSTASPGTVDGSSDGTGGNTQITNIFLDSGSTGINYNFFEGTPVIPPS